MAAIAFFCVAIFSLAVAQDIKLCPSGGPLHLPPPGCALRKNYVQDQDCYTIGVVCKEGQEETAAPAEATTAQAPEATSPESPEAGNTTAPEASTAQAPEGTSSETGSPTPEASTGQSPEASSPESETSAAPEASTAPPPEATSLESGNATEAAEPTTPSAEGTSPEAENTTAEAETTPEASGTPPPSTAASIDETNQQQNSNKGFCPVYNESTPAECGEGERTCTQDSECGVTQLCCNDAPCKRTVCKEKLLPCPPEDSEVAGATGDNCRTVTVVDSASNCVKVTTVCGEAGNANASGNVVVVVPPLPTEGEKQTPSSVLQVVPPTSGSPTEGGNANISSLIEAVPESASVPPQTGNETVSEGQTEPGLLPLPIGGEVAPIPVNLPAGVVPAKVVPGSDNVVPPVSSNTSSEASQTPRFCPIANDTAPAEECEKSLNQCSKDDDCSMTQACCDDKACGAKMCKESLLPCPADDSEATEKPSDCSGGFVVDQARNCVKVCAST